MPSTTTPQPAGSSALVAPNVMVSFLVLIMIWFAIAHELLPLSAVAPPLFVSVYEWIGRQQKTIQGALLRVTSMVVAAASGELAAHVLPVVLGGILAVAATYGVMRLHGTIDPPALAIALLPIVAQGIPPLNFIGGLALAALVLYLAAIQLPFVSSRHNRASKK